MAAPNAASVIPRWMRLARRTRCLMRRFLSAALSAVLSCFPFMGLTVVHRPGTHARSERPAHAQASPAKGAHIRDMHPICVRTLDACMPAQNARDLLDGALDIP